MNALSPYVMAGTDDYGNDPSFYSQQQAHMSNQPFISILELVGEVYQVLMILVFLDSFLKLVYIS